MGRQATGLAAELLAITLTIRDLLAHGRLREVGELTARRGEIIGRLSALPLPEQAEADGVIRQTLALLAHERRRLVELRDAVDVELGKRAPAAAGQVGYGHNGTERSEAVWWA